MSFLTRLTLSALSLLPLVGCEAAIEDDPRDPPLIQRPMTPDDDDGDGIPDTLIPAPGGLRRLTTQQYINSVRDLTGIDLGRPALEPDTAINGFVAIGSSRTTISALGVEQYETAAFDVAGRVIASSVSREALVGCTASDTEPGPCLRGFIGRFGRRAWRRPLAFEEIERYALIGEEAVRTLGSFWNGVEFAIAGLLQSPNFLFRAELGSGELVEGETNIYHYDDWEMASRLSFAICNTTPDDILLDAANASQLTNDAALRSQVERLMGSPCARESVRGFFDELFAITELAAVVKDADAYPQTSETLGASMREGLLATVERWVLEDNVSYDEFYTRSDLNTNAELAALYGLDAPAGDEFVRREDPRRPGLLGQAAFLAQYSHSNRNSPTLRGKFVRTALLCGTIPPPPDDVGELPEPDPTARTLRERLAVHRENPACASCHVLMDPIGLALENFDGVGVWRTEENGVVLDVTGELNGVSYDDGLGLGRTLADADGLMECLVRNLYRYSTGHIETSGETKTILELARDFDERGLIRELMVDLFMSEGFRLAGDAQ